MSPTTSDKQRKKQRRHAPGAVPSQRLRSLARKAGASILAKSAVPLLNEMTARMLKHYASNAVEIMKRRGAGRNTVMAGDVATVLRLSGVEVYG